CKDSYQVPGNPWAGGCGKGGNRPPAGSREGQGQDDPSVSLSIRTVETLAQALVRSSKAPADRGHANPKPLGNLDGLEVLEVPEQHGASKGLLELEDEIHQAALQLRLLQELKRAFRAFLGPGGKPFAPATVRLLLAGSPEK